MIDFGQGFMSFPELEKCKAVDARIQIAGQ
jgi:hypothetical protein